MNKKLYPLLVLMMIAANVFAQSDSVLRHNIRALKNYAVNHPIEKVHLHLDRQFYFPGDTIWFKAYTVTGPGHQLSALSNILYAELISPNDSLIKRLTLGLQAGTAPGDFELPYNIPPGLYRIRAYTNWMRNYGQEYFFDQLINVAGFNTLPVVANPSGASDKIDLQFFPEGGGLVNGLRSKVAFKAVNKDGVAEEVQGSIVDNDGNEVAAFNSRHLGMGVFPLQPEAGKQYMAKVIAADGSRFTVLLPAANDAGYTLTLNNSAGDSLYIKVAAKNVRDTAFYLLAQSGGKYYYAAARKLEDKTYVEAIEKSRFPTGIVQFTLFGQNGEPLNSRIVFIQNDDQLKLSLGTDKQTYSPGEQVRLSMEANNEANQPVAGTFSVSVVDESQLPDDETAENTIVSDILLRSEIGGYIHNPNYYFINPNEKTKADLDLLMLTQGYHRFEWKKILAGNDSAAYRPEKGFTLSGSVSTPGGKPVPGGKVILTSTKNLLVLDTLTDRNGKFAFNDLVLPDTAKLVINAQNANGKENVVLKIDKQDFPAITPVNRKEAGYIANHYRPDAAQVKQAYTVWKQDSVGHVVQLKEVTVKDKKTPPYHPDYSVLLKYSTNLNGPGQANQVYLPGDDILKYTSLPQALSGKLDRVDIMINQFGHSYAVNFRASMRGGKKMALFVNGTEVPPDFLDDISPADVYSVEVLTSARYYAVYGSDATSGALVITLKNGSEILDQKTISPGLVTYSLQGVYKPRQFYSFRYPSPRTLTLADVRRTVFWGNELPADKDGRHTISYFNARDKGDYRITIEGLDGEGRPVTQLLSYKVELNN